MLIVTLGSIVLNADVLQVCPRCPLQRVEDAVKQATAGDTIALAAGVYPDTHVLIEKSLFIVGTGRPILDGNGQGTVLTVRRATIHLQGWLLLIPATLPSMTVQESSSLNRKEVAYVILRQSIAHLVWHCIVRRARESNASMHEEQGPSSPNQAMAFTCGNPQHVRSQTAPSNSIAMDYTLNLAIAARSRITGASRTYGTVYTLCFPTVTRTNTMCFTAMGQGCSDVFTACANGTECLCS